MKFGFTELHLIHPDFKTDLCQMRVVNWHVTKRQLDYSVNSSAYDLRVPTFSVKACLQSPVSSLIHQQLSVVSCPATVLHQPLCITMITFEGTTSTSS